MRFYGRVYKAGKFWLSEVPILNAMTQGHTRKEAFSMIADLIETLVNRPNFIVKVYPGKNGDFEVSSSDTRTLVSLLLKRQRELSGMSLADASKQLGSKSRNTYARYERGTLALSLGKLTELLKAVSSGRDFVLHQSIAV